MTIQTLFDRCMLYDNQLDLISGGDDVTRGLVAVNLVQDWWEIVAARYPAVCQSKANISTAANTESTTISSPSLRRIDTIWRLDSNSNQVEELDPIEQVGGHTPRFGGLYNQLAISPGLGIPDSYYFEGSGLASSIISWSPKPDAIYTMRVYGLWAASDYTAASNTFAYGDAVALAMGPFVAQLFRTGLERDLTAVQGAAEAAFENVIRGIKRAVRVKAASKVYADVHDT